MKFTFEQKLAAVKLHIETKTYDYPIGYRESKSVRASYQHKVKFWEAKYRQQGEDGLKHGFNDVYSPERKLMIIEPVMRFEISLTKQSIITGIKDTTIGSWIKRYKLLGMDGLKCSKRGRPPKNMPNITNVKEAEEPEVTDGSTADNIRSLLEQISQLKKDNAALKDINRDLEHKDILSQAEIDYLKKLHALAETKRKSETRKKHGSSKRSAKAEDTKED